MKTKIGLTLMLGSLLAGCATTNFAEDKAAEKRRVVIDNTYHRPALPDWTRDGKLSWEEKDVIVFKAQHTVRGDQRVDSCFDLAKMDLKENLVTEISSNLRGEINLASEGMSEASETAITKSFTQQLEADIAGLKLSEQLFERYLNADIERIDCFVMGKMTRRDYEALRMRVLQNTAKSNSELAQILKHRQLNFFNRDLPQNTSKVQELKSVESSQANVNSQPEN